MSKFTKSSCLNRIFWPHYPCCSLLLQQSQNEHPILNLYIISPCLAIASATMANWSLFLNHWTKTTWIALIWGFGSGWLSKDGLSFEGLSSLHSLGVPELSPAFATSFRYSDFKSSFSHTTSKVGHSRCHKMSRCLMTCLFLCASGQMVEEQSRVF